MFWSRKKSPTPQRHPVAGCRPTSPFRPRIEVLEGREVPSVSAITSNFNGTAIAPSSTVWFNAVAKVTGLGSSPVSIRLDSGSITSPVFNIGTPNVVLNFSPTATSASTSFDSGTNTWTTTIPPALYSGSSFLNGIAFQVPGGLAGGTNPVTWSANFTTDTPGVNVQWKWAAAVYTSFSSDFNALNVKPVEGSNYNPYHNSHHAGTPESFASFVVGGARGGGGSNFTGSYSATKLVTPNQASMTRSSLSGYVYDDRNSNQVFDEGDQGIADMLIALDGINDLGQEVHMTATTDANGYYVFSGLRAGTYTLTELSQPSGYLDGFTGVGTQESGESTDNSIFNIVLASGVNGMLNNFGEVLNSN